MSYTYTKNNILEEPYNYMYSSYHGVSFLNQYLTSRAERIEAYKDSSLACLVNGDQFLASVIDYLGRPIQSDSILDKKTSEYMRFHLVGLCELASIDEKYINQQDSLVPGPYEPIDVVETKPTLKFLLTALLIRGFTRDDVLLLNKFVQRFEVSKKLYSSYSEDFRKPTGSFTDLYSYWLFAVVLVIQYSRTNELKFLSVLLKVCDLLCSLPERELLDVIPANGIVRLLALELTCAVTLMDDKDLPHDFV